MSLPFCARIPRSRRPTWERERMPVIFALIGAKALYLLLIWLASAIIASWLSARSGYGEKAGLASGLLLTIVGAIVWVVFYAAFPRPGSSRAEEGFYPRRRGADDADLPDALGAHGVELVVVLVEPDRVDVLDVGARGDVVLREVVVEVVAELVVHEALLVQRHRQAHGHAADELRARGLG